MAEVKNIDIRRLEEIKNTKKKFNKWRDIMLPMAILGTIVLFLSVIISNISFFKRFLIFLIGLAPILGLYFSYSLKVIKAWEEGVVFRKGRIHRELDPGWAFIFWPIDNVKYVSVYEVKNEILNQDIFTSERYDREYGQITRQMPATISIVFWGKVTDPVSYLTKTEDIRESVPKIVQSQIRNSASSYCFEEISGDKQDILLKDIEKNVNIILHEWGYEITKVQIQSIKPSPEILRAQEQIQITDKKREAALIEAETRTQVMRMLDKADPDFRRRGLDTLVNFKGSIYLFGSTVEEIIDNLTRGQKKLNYK
jgi:regulator of protease activity HflC (stomatin/prohibitin superfamily)